MSKSYKPIEGIGHSDLWINTYCDIVTSGLGSNGRVCVQLSINDEYVQLDEGGIDRLIETLTAIKKEWKGG